MISCESCGSDIEVGSNKSYCGARCQRIAASKRFVANRMAARAVDIDASPNYLGKYFASEDGLVYECLDGKWFLMASIDRNGYQSIKIDRKNVRIHRIVATVYHPKPEGKDRVNHIDGNKKNNRPVNLEWVTDMENFYHATSIGLVREDKRPRAVVGFSSAGNGVFFRSIREASQHGFCQRGIRKALARPELTSHGYSWQTY